MDRPVPSKINAITERSIRPLNLKAEKRLHCTEDRCTYFKQTKTVWNYVQHKPLEIHPIKSGFLILLNQLKNQNETQNTTSPFPPPASHIGSHLSFPKEINTDGKTSL